MTSVRLQELKNNLSRYLASVRNGEVVVVTEHGRPIARIEPVNGSTGRKPLEELAAKGLIRLPTRPRDTDVPAPLKVGGKPLSEMVIEDRG